MTACGGDDASSTMEPTPSFSYVATEPERAGKLLPEKADALGVQGFQRGQLKQGMSVLNRDGEEVRPDQVCCARLARVLRYYLAEAYWRVSVHTGRIAMCSLREPLPSSGVEQSVLHLC